MNRGIDRRLFQAFNVAAIDSRFANIRIYIYEYQITIITVRLAFGAVRLH